AALGAVPLGRGRQVALGGGLVGGVDRQGHVPTGGQEAVERVLQALEPVLAVGLHLPGEAHERGGDPERVAAGLDRAGREDLAGGGEDVAAHDRLGRRGGEGRGAQLVAGEAGQRGDERREEAEPDEPDAPQRQLRRVAVGDADRCEATRRLVGAGEGGVGAQRHTVLSSRVPAGGASAGAGSGATADVTLPCGSGTMPAAVAQRATASGLSTAPALTSARATPTSSASFCLARSTWRASCAWFAAPSAARTPRRAR